VNAVRLFRALGPADGRTVARDPMLRWLCIAPFLFALALRWVAPPLFARVGERIGADLTGVYPPLLGFGLLALLPMLAGMVVGFLLLDQRDDDTLTALRVTPLPLGGYLAYRVALPLVLGLVLAAALLPLAGVGGLGIGALLAAAAGAAPLAPVIALFLAAFAANKVQGFALTKVSGVLLLPPLVAWFTAAEWQWLFWIVPTYWPARGYWALLEGDPGAGAYLLAGIGYQLLLVALLLRRFARVTAR
jgi:fluoroquinolone transport system permease protein